jgi:hypothetical protein
MSKQSGYLITYTDNGGNLQKGIVYYSEQSQQFVKVEKVFIRLCNDDLTPKLDEHQKRLVTLKQADQIKITGFIN